MRDAVSVRAASLDDLESLAPLFDAYRVFYEERSDPGRARDFLEERLSAGDSVVFLAQLGDEAAGFVQMYPLYSSVSTARIWILNDLFVSPGVRRRGVAKSLLEHAVEWARQDGAHKVILETAIDNGPAKNLYELLGWKRQTSFDSYECVLDAPSSPSSTG